MRSTPLLTSLPGLLRPGVVEPDPIYPAPSLGQDMTQGQFFKRSLADAIQSLADAIQSFPSPRLVA